MKKVWILEQYMNTSDLEESVATAQSYLATQMEENANEEVLIACHHWVEHAQQDLVDNPNGKWVPVEGKSAYNYFCQLAKQQMRLFPKSQFRVMEAKIEDNAKSWVKYKDAVQNEGVLRYLRATA